MLDPKNEERRPDKGRRSTGSHQGGDDYDRIPDHLADTLMADRWAAHVRAIVRPYVESCAYCAVNRRHPESPYCLGCLEIGAGDVWQGGAA